jgi:hypothetical protein
VSCASPGNCVAGGYYGDVNGVPYSLAFVHSDVNGTWGELIQIPEASATAGVYSVSRSPVGGCTAVGGTYVVSQN